MVCQGLIVWYFLGQDFIGGHLPYMSAVVRFYSHAPPSLVWKWNCPVSWGDKSESAVNVVLEHRGTLSAPHYCLNGPYVNVLSVMHSCALSLQTCKCQLFLRSYHTLWLYGSCVQPRRQPYKCWDFNDVISSQSLWSAAFLLNISMSDGSCISIRGKSNLFQSTLSDPIREELKLALMLATQLSVVSPKLWNVDVFSRQSVHWSLVAGGCRA